MIMPLPEFQLFDNGTMEASLGLIFLWVAEDILIESNLSNQHYWEFTNLVKESPK